MVLGEVIRVKAGRVVLLEQAEAARVVLVERHVATIEMVEDSDVHRASDQSAGSRVFSSASSRPSRVAGGRARQRGVVEAAHHRSGLRGVLLVQGDGLGLAHVGEVLRVLSVHCVQVVHRHRRLVLPGRDGLEEPRDAGVPHRDVVRGHADRPLLGGGHLLPVGVAELFEHARRLLDFRLELLRQCVGLRSHDGPSSGGAVYSP